MPPTSTSAPEPTITVTRSFVEDVHAFGSEWLADFHDYANDSFGDATEQAAREHELARIQRITETSEALLLPAVPAAQDEFHQWLQELTHGDSGAVIESMPSNPAEPGATGLRVKLNTALFSYAITAQWYTDEHGDRSYLGAIAARHGNGGCDLADGPATADTWRRILRDIVALEMTQYHAQDADPDPQLAHARAHRSFPSEVTAAYEPNGDLIVSLSGDTARHIAQQAQAAQLTTDEYLQAKLGKPTAA